MLPIVIIFRFFGQIWNLLTYLSRASWDPPKTDLFLPFRALQKRRGFPCKMAKNRGPCWVPLRATFARHLKNLKQNTREFFDTFDLFTVIFPKKRPFFDVFLTIFLALFFYVFFIKFIKFFIFFFIIFSSILIAKK